MSCGVGHRHGSDPELPWLWCRPAAAAHGNTRALTHWSRPGIKPVSSSMLVRGSLTTEPQWELRNSHKVSFKVTPAAGDFPGYRIGRRNPNRDQPPLWVEETEFEALGGKDFRIWWWKPEERATQKKLGRVPLESSAEYSSVHACEKTTNTWKNAQHRWF